MLSGYIKRLKETGVLVIKVVKSFIIVLSLAMSLSGVASSISERIGELCPDCNQRAQRQTATLILDRGQTALYTRAWLAQNAQQSIDIQYFIWSDDNIGVLAAEALLQAANRGVKVRVIVDDFLIDADTTSLLSLAAHKNIEIKIYNPKHKVGVSKIKRLKNLALDFRDSNQRMHDKLVIFDDMIAITGGRNMADEYFDFDRQYSFRDRDALVYGKSIAAMKESFERFWSSDLSLSLETLLQDKSLALSQAQIDQSYAELTEYANNSENFAPEIRDSIADLSARFNTTIDEMRWSDAYFIYDMPGKNDGTSGLSGGGKSTDAIIELVKSAQKEIIIQSPYLIMSKDVIALFKQRIDEGITIKISTNSLASTDNMMAYSGYHKVRDAILEAGIELYEYKPAPINQIRLHQRYLAMRESPPIFAIHAKSMVIDKKIAAIGTFNFDPRSINLNTEVGIIIPEKEISAELYQLITDDMAPGNSWRILKDQNPDDTVSFWKRMKLFAFKLLPLEPVL